MEPTGELLDFQAYERLGLHGHYSANLRETVAAKEKLAWKLHQEGGPAGSILLAFELLEKGYSNERPGLKTRSFARDLIFPAHDELQARSDKTDWDWYWLGHSTSFVGRYTEESSLQAAEAFLQSTMAGNSYAEFEEIWLRYLLGASAYECVVRFSRNAGPLAEFSARAARALTVLTLGTTRDKCSPQRAARILELWRMHSDFYRHTQGSRKLRQEASAALAQEAIEDPGEDTPIAWLIRYLIPPPLKRDPNLLLNALDPDNTAIAWVLGDLQTEDLLLMKRACDANGWEDSGIGRAISQRTR